MPQDAPLGDEWAGRKMAANVGMGATSKSSNDASAYF
jgi:hypothetical protein